MGHSLWTKPRIWSHEHATIFWRVNDISASTQILHLIFQTVADISLSTFRAITFTSAIHELRLTDYYCSESHLVTHLMFLMICSNLDHTNNLNANFILNKFWSKLPKQNGIFVFSVAFFLEYISNALSPPKSSGDRRLFHNFRFRLIPVKSCGPKQATIIRLISADDSQSLTCAWSMPLRNEDSEYMDKIYEPGWLLETLSVMAV